MGDTQVSGAPKEGGPAPCASDPAQTPGPLHTRGASSILHTELRPGAAGRLLTGR